MKRTVVPELLDSDLGTPAEIQASLADLRFINRWFGGISTTESMLERMLSRSAGCANAGQREFSMLEVGSGSGDIPLAVSRRMAERNVRIRVVLLDRSVAHLPPVQPSGMRAVAADAFALPFRAASFDVVSCALLVHHLDSQEVARFVNEALRVARRALLINDLRRSRMHLAAVYAGFLLYRSRLTRHDGPASVRRAYTREELAELLRQTDAGAVEMRNHYLFRMGAIVWKNAPTI